MKPEAHLIWSFSAEFKRVPSSKLVFRAVELCVERTEVSWQVLVNEELALDLVPFQVSLEALAVSLLTSAKLK